MGLFKCAVFAVCFAGGCTSTFGQQLSVGFVGGASLTQDFQNASLGYGNLPVLVSYSTPKRLVAGAMLDVTLPLHFSVEVDGLYHELEFTQSAVLPKGTLNSVSPAPVVTWEFPILAKYRFSLPALSPFIEAGPSFRAAGNLNGTSPSNHGLTIGAGIEKQLWKIRVAPQLRYTRWTRDTGGYPVTKPDQLELLVGFSANSGPDWHPWGHRVSFGAVLGTNLTDDFRNISFGDTIEAFAPNGTATYTRATFLSYSGPKSFLAGPMIDLQLPHQLSLEVDAIHRPVKSVNKVIVPGGSSSFPVDDFSSSYTVTTWQFPVLAKCKFAFPFAEHFPKLFVEAGPSFRLSQQVKSGYLSNYGVTGGLGIAAHVRALKIAPVVRYSHWGSDNPPGSSETLRNEVQLLIGFSF